jgi:hypothetical protein
VKLKKQDKTTMFQAGATIIVARLGVLGLVLRRKKA